MEESKKSESSQVSPPGVEIEVYRQYRELARNEDRLFNERLMIFLTAHSILFISYITSYTCTNSFIHIIRIVVCFIGITLCGCGGYLAYSARLTWEIWMIAIKEMEKNFKKVKNLKYPHEARSKPENEESENFWRDLPQKMKWPWRIGYWVLPALFLILWGLSLVLTFVYS